MATQDLKAYEVCVQGKPYDCPLIAAPTKGKAYKLYLRLFWTEGNKPLAEKITELGTPKLRF